MRQLLAAGGIRLTRSLGQSFLHDANQLRRIVAAAELTKGDKVLEIGPGLGPLTELLVERAGEVLAIEKDARLVKVLESRFDVEQASRLCSSAIGTSSPASQQLQEVRAAGERAPTLEGTGGTPVLRLLHDDALDYLRREARDWSEWKLVANLPYSVASPILVELASGEPASSQARVYADGRARGGARSPATSASQPPRRRGPQRMVATLQLEVAKRLLANPGTADYGLLTLFIRLEYEPESWFKIPASCFFPEPDVDSACVCLVRRGVPVLPPAAQGAFAKIVRRSFSQRRKIMLKLLKEDWPEPRLVEQFERLKLPSRIRAEAVSIEQFAQLALALSKPAI
jgi:16S rRNA (adenine1518-N6/adenine1519-N6)-dimethyltransferase